MAFFPFSSSSSSPSFTASCALDGNVCQCDQQTEGTVDLPLSYSLSGTKLELGGPGFDYCVDGDTLSTRADTSGAVVVYQRVP